MLNLNPNQMLTTSSSLLFFIWKNIVQADAHVRQSFTPQFFILTTLQGAIIFFQVILKIC